MSEEAAALLRQGIAPLAGQLPIGESLLPGFLQRDQGESAEPELGTTATDGEALHPTPAARGPNIEIEALAVAVASGLADIAHEGGHEGVFGMLAARPCVAGGVWRASYPPLYPHKMMDARVQRGSPREQDGCSNMIITDH